MWTSSTTNDGDEALRRSLEEKIRAAEKLVRNQMGFEDDDDFDDEASYDEDEEDEEEDEEDECDEEL